MRKPRTASTASIKAPIGGLNAKDAIADMPEGDAVIMTNFFPAADSVDVRKGYASHSTGYASPVETLMGYNTGAAQELFAASGTSIYDATAAGAIGAAEIGSLTNARFQYATLGTSGGYFLLAVNGADKMVVYTGSAWYLDGTTTTVTGVDTATIININNFKNRVWLIEENSLNAWYLPVQSIGGAANKLDLSALFKLGGHLVTMQNWTIDNAAGIDDYAAFITSEGEVALYKGTDPSSANTWALVGTFRMGRPIGYRCGIKVAADVLLLTTDGAFPLSKALLTDRAQTQSAVTDKIVNLLKPDIQSYSSTFGWQPILHPFGNKIIINIPTVENSTAHQYVMNTETGSWCKFEGWNANCFETLQDTLYFGGATVVYKADTGEDDDGGNINVDCQQAFSYFKSKGRQKKFSMARPIFITSGAVNPAIILNTDFNAGTPTGSPSFTSANDSLWDVAAWDEADWVSGDSISKKWQSITGVGYSGGIRVKMGVKDLSIRWVSTDFVFEKGEVL